MVWSTVAEGIAQARREKAARERRDIPHEEIALAVGVTSAAYSRWEKGQRIPKEEDVQRLAAYFGVSPAYLRYGVRETDEETSARIGAPIGKRQSISADDLAEIAGKPSAKRKATAKGGRNRKLK